jgi:hypothetical protein
METVVEMSQTILKEVVSEDSETRAAYLKHFGKNVERFSDVMAKAFVNWRGLDAEVMVKQDVRLACVSSLVSTAIGLHILSMKLFVSGYEVPAGNLARQVFETISLALLCSGKGLGILERFMEGKYSSNDAVRDAHAHAEKLGLNTDALRMFEQGQKFYHNYSHITMLTIASGVSFSRLGTFYIGSSFDEAKLDQYEKEVKARVSLAEGFSNFIDGVKVNVSKW